MQVTGYSTSRREKHGVELEVSGHSLPAIRKEIVRGDASVQFAPSRTPEGDGLLTVT